MKGKEAKKEKKKEKSEGLTTKVPSDYQNQKTKKSIAVAIPPKAKK